MPEEQSRSPFNKPSAVPKEFAWPKAECRMKKLKQHEHN